MSTVKATPSAFTLFSLALLVAASAASCRTQQTSPLPTSATHSDVLVHPIGPDIRPDNWKARPAVTRTMLLRVFFLDQAYGWAVGQKGAAFRTTDGGRSWLGQPLGTEDDLFDVWFTDLKTGFVLGTRMNDQWRSTLWNTTDGGATWRRNSVSGADLMLSISFLDPGNGWVVGKIAGESNAGVLVRTHDGGASWESLRIQGDHPIDLDEPVVGATFVSEQEGWAISGSCIKHTTDGGAGWEAQYRKQYDATNDYGYRRIQFLDGMTGWVSGENDGDMGHLTGIQRTTDGGRTWTESRADHPLNKLHFINSAVGIGVGAASPADYVGKPGEKPRRDGIIMLTIDAGASWREIYRVPGRPLTDVFFTSNNHGWAVGSNGAMVEFTGQ